MTNSVSVNNPTGFLTLTSVSDQSATPQPVSSNSDQAFIATQEGVDQFSSTINETVGAIATIDSEINATEDAAKKQELTAKKQELVNKKQELEARQDVLKAKMTQIKAEMDSYKSTSGQIKNEIDKLTSNKHSLEKTIQNESKELANKNAALKTVGSQIGETKLALDDKIESLNDAVSEMTKRSEDELRQQRSAISAATSEALALVQSGEITSEEMPSYIAGRISGFDSVGSTRTTSIDANNSQVKSLCSQLAGYVDRQGTIQLSVKASSNKIQAASPLFEAISAQIKAKSSELSANEGLMNSKQSEFSAANAEYTRNNSQISNIDSQLVSIDSQISVVEAPVQKEKEAKTKGAVASNKVQYDQFFATKTSTTTLDFDAEMSKINSQYSQTLKEEISNSEIETLKSKMSDADKLITTLRTHLSDNAQKIIEERLAATKRK